MSFGHVLSRLQQVRPTTRGWMACCPAHNDRTPSLSLEVSPETGHLVMRCWAGCTFAAIIQALGIKASDCFDRQEGAMRQEAAHYNYLDESGRLLYQVVRFEPKSFAQRRPDGNGGWVWGLGDVRRVLYHLPALANPANQQRIVLVVEGEKDADRLTAKGFLATCNSGGAGKWLPQYATMIGRRPVVIIPDNDSPGREHAELVARSLQGVCTKSAILHLPGQDRGIKDISDWFDLHPGTAEELQHLCREALRNTDQAAREALQRLPREIQWKVIKEIIDSWQ